MAFGVALSVGGILMIADDGGSLLGYAFAPRLRSSTAGWMVLALGIIVSTAFSLSIMRRCPILELREEGIFYTRCLQGVAYVSWVEFDHAEIKRSTVPTASGGDIRLESIGITTTDGRYINIAPMAPVEEMLRAIKRAAANKR